MDLLSATSSKISKKEVVEYTDEYLSNKLVASIVTSRIMGIRRRTNRPREKLEVDKDSDKSTETFRCVYEAKKK